MPPPYKDPNGDEDRPYFQPVTMHSNLGRTSPASLSVDEIVAFGDVVIDALAHDLNFRRNYYNLSRTWHNAYFQSGGLKGGEFGEQLCETLEALHPPRRLQIDDFANLHMYIFLTLRRAVLAITGHDIDAGAARIEDAMQRGLGDFYSYHFPPNDGSKYTVTPTQLGFNEAAP